MPTSTAAAVTIKDCNGLLKARLGYLLHRLRSAGCLVKFKRGKTQYNGANREVVYILLQDESDLRCLDMVYAPQSLAYPDLRTATRQSVAIYIQQFAQDVQSICKLWAARQEYRIANGLAEIPNLANLVKISVAGISDAPSIWACGRRIPAYDLSFYYFSDSGLYNLYCAFSQQ